MNLLEGIDAKATARKLDEYEIAMGIKARPVEETGRGATRTMVSRSDSNPDPTGLIKGLKKIVAPPPKAVYDPFMGMPRTRDYYEVKDNYETRYDKLKKDPMFDPAGYDFHQYMDESLLRAFAGLGVFVEDEMKKVDETSTSIQIPVATKLEDDPF